jgi:hypothetical protein
MLRRVALVRTDVSEERIATIIRVTGIADPCHLDEALRSSNVGPHKSHAA